MKKVQKEGKEDELLILFVAMLTLAGLFFLYSTGTYNGKVKFGDAGYYLKKQLFASVLGMIAFWVMARIDYHRVAAFATVLYLCSIALSTAVLFVGRSYNGSKRWLALGPLSFQPAEFVSVIQDQQPEEKDRQSLVYAPDDGGAVTDCRAGGNK